jgi:hypothetical protein
MGRVLRSGFDVQSVGDGVQNYKILEVAEWKFEGGADAQVGQLAEVQAALIHIYTAA